MWVPATVSILIQQLRSLPILPSHQLLWGEQYTLYMQYTYGQIHRPKPPHKDAKISHSRGIEPVEFQSQQSDLFMGWS